MYSGWHVILHCKSCPGKRKISNTKLLFLQLFQWCLTLLNGRKQRHFRGIPKNFEICFVCFIYFIYVWNIQFRLKMLKCELIMKKTKKTSEPSVLHSFYKMTLPRPSSYFLFGICSIQWSEPGRHQQPSRLQQTIIVQFERV